MIPYYWYDDHNQEIKERLLEEGIVSWQQIQNMEIPRFADDSEESWTWTNNSIKDHTSTTLHK